MSATPPPAQRWWSGWASPAPSPAPSDSEPSQSRLPPLPGSDPRWQGDLRPYRTGDGRPMALFAAVAAHERVLADLRTATATALTAPLPLRFREVLVLRICARTACWSEWDVHVDLFATGAALTETDLADLCSGDGPAREPLDGLAVAVADELVGSTTLSEPVWLALCEAWGPDAALECLVLAGQYLKVAWLANALGLNR